MDLSYLLLLFISLITLFYIILRQDEKFSDILKPVEFDKIISNYNGFIICIDENEYINDHYFLKKIMKFLKVEQHSSRIIGFDISSGQFNESWALINKLNIDTLPVIVYIDKEQSRTVFNFNETTVNMAPKIIVNEVIRNYREI